MNRDTVIGFVLIALVLIGFSWYNQPSAEQIEAQRREDSIAAVMKDNAAKQQVEQAARKAEAEEAARRDTNALFHTAMSGQDTKVVLKNDKVELTLQTKGGTIAKAVIKGFKNIDNSKDEVTLFDEETQQMNFMLVGKQENIITQDMYFTPSNQSDSTVTMTAQAANGGSVVMDYHLGKDYMLHFSLRTNGLSGMFAPKMNQLDISWKSRASQQEKGFMFENRYATLTYKEKGGSTHYLSETSEETKTLDEDKLDWVAFKNQFFSAVLISKDDFGLNAVLNSKPLEKGTGFLKDYDASLNTAFDPTGQQASEFEMYIGPNDFRLIKEVEEQSTFGKDLDLEQLVYLGWPLFRIINRWFTIYVFDWLTSWGFSMGIVLILIT